MVSSDFWKQVLVMGLTSMRGDFKFFCHGVFNMILVVFSRCFKTSFTQFCQGVSISNS
jgi:hypothetical protein